MLLKTQNTKSQTQRLAWQGWSVTVPDSWNPVKVDGDEHDGSLLLADLHAAKLGLRWKTLGKRHDPAKSVEKAMRDEVGKLAAAEAIPFSPADLADGLLYRDPAPPGRDVFVVHSPASGRLLEVVHHADKRSNAFADAVLPSLDDTAADAGRDWSLFDLSFRTPADVRVRWYRFNAGDLSVGLESKDRKKRGVTVVRQIGPAALALARQPLTGWLTQLPAATLKLYRPIDSTTPKTLELEDGRTTGGLAGTLRRKRRLWWAWMVRRQQTALAFHDTARDRILFGQSADEAFLRGILATVGRAAEAAS